MTHREPTTDTPDERLSAWLDGELSDAEQRELEAELARDPALRADFEALESVVRLVREEGPTVAPPGFHGRVMARVADLEPAPSGGIVAVVSSWFRRWEAIALVGVAVASLLLFLPMGLPRGDGAAEDPSPAAGKVALPSPSPSPSPSPPSSWDGKAEVAQDNGAEPSVVVPQTKVVGRARVEPKPPATSPSQQGTNLAWEPAVVEPPPTQSPEPSSASPAAGRYLVSSDDPALKRRVLALASRYGNVKDPSGRPVTSAERSGTEELVVTVSQAELPAFTRGLVGLGFDVGTLPEDLLAGDRVELRLVLVGGEPAAPRAAAPSTDTR